ncbi:DUF4097 domain-containing protein [Luteibacter aegosomatis]|uniref:DUF4097 family beta strand repeat-containing protein n=1 Tax=Luteibacter aegosomatis TaxID=2911537 RepID=UPI001FFBB6D3|nr:DUF4097 family beta strand repeat-containing protein [Luteibacter aegosomatis]UPG86638.1 DUF4097 domain-containing protein [Luteibacter aegosomatis]
MRHLILAAVLLMPAVALAYDEPQCRFGADRHLDLDMGGVHRVRFVVNSHDLQVDGSGSGKSTVDGRACASSQDIVDSLVVEQEKEGDTLVVELKDKRHGWSGFGNSYAYLKVKASIPGNLPVVVEGGSGDVEVRHVASLRASAGSGDVEANDVRGEVQANVGSGDLKLSHTGPVEVSSVGSGDLTVRDARGVRIGTVGSGDAKLTDIQGDVNVGTVGSGDLVVDGVKGNLTVRSHGSGDIEHHDVSGKVDVPRDDD